ncbi:MAG: response regulator [Alphaproteobacteria bacterium]|nr:response regulator [Alphaproteobacteria bacterium]
MIGAFHEGEDPPTEVALTDHGTASGGPPAAEVPARGSWRLRSFALIPLAVLTLVLGVMFGMRIGTATDATHDVNAWAIEALALQERLHVGDVDGATDGVQQLELRVRAERPSLAPAFNGVADRVASGHAEAITPLVVNLLAEANRDIDEVATASTGSIVVGMVACGIVMAGQFLLVMLLRHGDSIEALLVARDRAVGEAAQAVETAREADRSKSALLARVSHELRTPLNGVLGMLSVLRERPLPVRVRADLDVVHDAASALRGLVDELLDQCRADAGSLTMSVGPVPVARVVRDVTSLFENSARTKGLRLTAHLGPGVPDGVLGDEKRFRQVVTNLVDNAVKYTVHGRVEVSVAVAGAVLQLRVRDTGPGIPEEQRDAIFQPFGRLARDVAVNGSGLGLSLCRTLATLMGGTLTVEDTSSGTTMLLEVPCVPVPLPSGGGRGSAVRPEDSVTEDMAPHALVVDDQLLNRKVATAMLHSCGASFDEAADGREAFDKAIVGDFDLVIMDVEMPIEDGLSATARLRDAGYGGAIVGLTGDATPERRQRCFDVGMDDVMVKPVTVDEVRAMLAEHVRGSRAGRRRPYAHVG